jgi:plasmid stabilization system protein ParE
MEKYGLRISDLAKRDIRNIASYIKYDLQEPARAIKTTVAVLDAIFTLEFMPERICLVNDERLAKRQGRILNERYMFLVA